MKSKFSEALLKNNGKLSFWIGAVCANIITFLIIYYKIRPTGETLALHYNVVVGVDVLGAGGQLYRIPLIGTILLIVNMSLSKFSKSPDNSLSFLASVTSFAVAVILCVATLFLLRVN